MGKLINMGRARFRRMGIFDGQTEEGAERMRAYIDWKRHQSTPEARAAYAMRQKPPAQPGSKVQLTVVKRRQP